MNFKKIAGIDYSLTSPAICVYKEEEDGGYFDFDRCVFHYLEVSTEDIHEFQEDSWD